MRNRSRHRRSTRDGAAARRAGAPGSRLRVQRRGRARRAASAPRAGCAFPTTSRSSASTTSRPPRSPPLTTLAVDKALGRRGVELLLAEAPERTEISLPVELIVRASSRRLPGTRYRHGHRIIMNMPRSNPARPRRPPTASCAVRREFPRSVVPAVAHRGHAALLRDERVRPDGRLLPLLPRRRQHLQPHVAPPRQQLPVRLQLRFLRDAHWDDELQGYDELDWRDGAKRDARRHAPLLQAAFVLLAARRWPASTRPAR